MAGLLLLASLLVLGGCSGLRGHPRFGPEGTRPAESPADSARQERKLSRQEAKAKPRDARKGGGLPSFRLHAQPRPEVLKAAHKYLGVPYRYGGNTRRGMDCSGLVWRAARDAWGRELPRSSAEMARLGMPVSRAELQPGDLVFFHTGSRRRISHVGIYEGGGLFIHSSTTKGVEIAGLDEGYWRRRLISARRVSPETLSR